MLNNLNCFGVVMMTVVIAFRTLNTRAKRQEPGTSCTFLRIA